MTRLGIHALTIAIGLGVPAHRAAPAGIQTVVVPGGRQSRLDVEQLFAGTCGWCHADGGRVAGKGPQLMGTHRTDDFIRNRIRSGKPGAMPAFGQNFSDADIDAIIHYIRGLMPDEN